MSTKLKRWNGNAIEARVKRAAKDSIDETTRDAARIARNSHWWVNRTGQLESEIGWEKATYQEGELVGKFGTSQRRGFYGMFLEHKRPFLRPASDIAFRRLAGNIARRI